MEVSFEYVPLAVHEPFHRSTAYERCLFGAFGSGKTYAICAEAIAWGLEQPGSRILITRRTIPELRDTTETVFFDILPDELFRAGETKRIGGHYERFTLPNGSVFLFRSIDDWQKHKSLNVCAIAWDEADEFDEETYLGMSSRIRQRDPTAEGRRVGAGPIRRRGMWAASNPAGHDWLYNRFVNPKSAAKNTTWFKSTSLDNPYLPAEYIRSLFQYPEPWVKRYVLCQFDDFAGQIYEEWAWDTHVLEPLRSYSEDRLFWMGMDPGMEVPTAGLWVYVDRENRRLIGVDEYQETNIAADVHAAAWRKIEADHKMRVRWRVADPTITRRDMGSGLSLHTQYQKLGYNFQLGPKQYQHRIPLLGQLIHNRRFVVTKACPMAYEQIKNYQWEDLTPAMRAKGIDPQEKPLKKDDHLVNCAEYIASRWVKPLPLNYEAPATTEAELIHKTIKKQIIQKARPQQEHDLGSVLV